MKSLEKSLTPTAGEKSTAARWALLQTSGQLAPNDARELSEWLHASPHHETLYSQAREALQVLSDCADSPQLRALRKQARRSFHTPRKPFFGVEFLSNVLRGRSLMIGAAVAMALLLVLLSQSSGWDFLTGATAHATYQTAVGERKTLTLPDSSVVTMDTGSTIEVDYSRQARLVRLLQGQALFDVAGRASQPFQVQAVGKVITALGTSFNVRVDGNRLNVTLLQGKVHVRPLAQNASVVSVAPIALVPGQKLIVWPGVAPTLTNTDPQNDTSWMHGNVVFEDQTLAEAISEINRYSAISIRLQGDIGGRYRLSGTYSATDPVHFARSMTALFPLALRTTADGAWVLQPRT